MEQSLEVRIGRYLAGEMSEQEILDFEQEVSSSPALQAMLGDYKRIWDLSPGSVEASDWDTTSAWNRFESLHPEKSRQTGTRKWILRWAAAATLLLLLGTYWTFRQTSGPRHYAGTGDTVEPIVLSDGSRVYLNEGADIAVHRFTRKFREVDLYGEAFFEIAPDSKRPFKIMAGGTVTEVVGTSFNIRQTSEQTSIVVSSGKVIFSSEADTEIAVALAAGEAAVFENQKMQLIPNPSPNLHAWRTHQLEFKNMPLSDVVRDVSDYFDQKIRIENDDIRSCRISIIRPFRQPEIQSLLNAIAASINATIEKEGDTLVIKGGSCS